MLIKTLSLGQFETNCYIVTNEKTLECVIVDPGDESNTILNYIEDNKLKPQAIFITHGHMDHVGAADAVRQELNIPVYMNEKDDENRHPGMWSYPMPQGGIYNKEGDVIEKAGMSFRIIETPGHTPGGVSIICEDVIFTGDTLFQGSAGRTDMEGGDTETELRSLKKLCMLPGDYEVYPGHMGPSTLERERNFNYYCRLAMEKF